MAAAAVCRINPRQDFPAWLAAHGVSLSVAEAVDRELGIGDYEAFLACAEQPHIRAELFAAARERLPFAFYAVLRRITEASSPKRHDGAGAAAAIAAAGGGGLQATGNAAAVFQPFLSGLLDAIVLMLNSLSQELLHSAERFSCLEPALYPRTERDSRMYMEDEGMSEGYSAEDAAQSAAQTAAGLNDEVDGQQADTWEENEDLGEGDLIGPDGRVAADGVASHSHGQDNLQEDSAGQGSSTWGLGTVKAEQATEAEVKTPVLDEDGPDSGHVWKDIKVEKREKYCHGADAASVGDGEPAELMHCADSEGVATQNEWGLPADGKGPHGAEGEWREEPEEGLYPVDTNIVPHQRPSKHSMQLFGDWRGHDSRAWVHGKQAAAAAAAAAESSGASRSSFDHQRTVVTGQWNVLWESSPAQANVGCPLPSADSDHTAYQGAIPHIERCVQHIPGPAAGGEPVRTHSTSSAAAAARAKSRRYGSARARASAAAYAVIAAATGGTMTAPFTCTLCGQTFGKKYALLSHQRKHTGEKPYECSQCGKRFRVSNNLARHKRSHTGERPFACEQCGKRFVTSDSLGYHRQLHVSKRLLH